MTAAATANEQQRQPGKQDRKRVEIKKQRRPRGKAQFPIQAVGSAAFVLLSLSTRDWRLEIAFFEGTRRRQSFLFDKPPLIPTPTRRPYRLSKNIPHLLRDIPLPTRPSEPGSGQAPDPDTAHLT